MSAALEASFAEMSHAELPGLHRFAAGVGGSNDADDLVQAALEAMYLAWPRVHGVEHPGAYARTVLLRLLLREQRRARWRRETTTAHPPDRGTADPTASADDRVDLADLLSTLTVKQRAVLVLRYVEDRPVGEVAAVLGVSQGTVKRRSFDALELLRRQISPVPARSTP